MITPLSFDQIKKIHSVEFFEDTKISRVGGLTVFLAFLDKISLKAKLQHLLGEAATTAFLQIMLGICLGAKTMEQVEEFTKDKMINGFLPKTYDATYIPRVLKNLLASQIQALHELCLSTGLMDIVQDTKKDSFLTLDFDATGVEKYGTQEGVEYGYLEKDTIEKCYQYLFIRNDKLDSLLYGTIRGGAAHSQNDFCGYLRSILPMFAGEWRLRIRADSGYFNEEAFEICGENKVFFFIKAPMSESRRNQARSKALTWSADLTDPSIEYASYETVTTKGWIYREVFKRYKDETSKDGYQYHCVATNDMSRVDFSCYNFYNGRARIENQICELKEDLALGKLVTHDFGVNDIITQATILLSQLFHHFQRHCLDKVHKDLRLKTLRNLIFLIPAEILRSGRKQWFRIYNLKIDGLTYSRIFARIKRLATLLVLVPQFDTS